MTRVLAVDDSEPGRSILAQLLTGAGYEAITAATAAQALTLAIERRPDVIVTDVIMPEKTGLDLLADLRADQRTAAIPVVLYTGWDLADQLASGVLGANVRVVMKPAEHSQLLAVVRSALGETEEPST